jgi:hypothetical protein
MSKLYERGGRGDQPRRFPSAPAHPAREKNTRARSFYVPGWVSHLTRASSSPTVREHGSAGTRCSGLACEPRGGYIHAMPTPAKAP